MKALSEQVTNTAPSLPARTFKQYWYPSRERVRINPWANLHHVSPSDADMQLLRRCSPTPPAQLSRRSRKRPGLKETHK
eukprot:596426-Amphidinium_carterae.1